MTIDSGKVEARIRPEIYAKTFGMREQIHESLDNRFRGVQLLTHTPYELSKASMYRLHPDGRKDRTTFAESGVITLSVSDVDIAISDKDGNVVTDTRAERISRKRELSERVEHFRPLDPLVSVLVDSYTAAVSDPANELIHLYEIREALAKRFGNGHNAQSTLSVPRARWSRLGQLADDEPVKQGRHRGKNPGTLRDASEDELGEGPVVAKLLPSAIWPPDS